MRPTVARTFATSACWMFVVLLAMPVNGASRLPVLFVHGHGMSAYSWDSAIDALRQQGYRDAELYAIDIVPNVQSNVTSATDDIAPAVEKLLREARGTESEAPISKVNIVAHSMGAFSARWYASKIAPQRVNALITIAGANHGTNALCKYPEQDGAAEMCPAFALPADGRAGRVQNAINFTRANPRDETPYGVAPDPPRVMRIPPVGDKRIYYFTLRIADDEWIQPSESAVLLGAGGTEFRHGDDGIEETSAGNYLFASRYGVLRRKRDHCSLLYDDAVLALLAGLLRDTDRRYLNSANDP